MVPFRARFNLALAICSLFMMGGGGAFGSAPNARSSPRIGVAPIVYSFVGTAAALAASGIALQDTGRRVAPRQALDGRRRRCRRRRHFSERNVGRLLPVCRTAASCRRTLTGRFSSTTLPASMFSTVGTSPARVNLTFADRGLPGAPAISAYCGLYYTVATGGAGWADGLHGAELRGVSGGAGRIPRLHVGWERANLSPGRGRGPADG